MHIGRCIARIRPIARRIVVIDSFSTDDTVAIARSLSAEVLEHPFVNHADQLGWGLEAANITTDWVLRLDCDEYLEEGLLRELAERLPGLPDAVTGIEFRLKLIFRKRFIRWGGYHRTWLLRLWRRGEAGIEPRWMDERMVLNRGGPMRLHDGDLVDENLKDIGWWTSKHNVYATRHMIDIVGREHGLLPHPRRRRFLRDVVYPRAPLYWRAALYYLQRYVLRLGFLDGREGFVWHFLQGFWIFVLIDAKVDEARAYIREHGIEAFKAHVRDRHGIEL